MKNIYKIVLTGGPCGGKTTLISKIQQVFSDKGFRVFTINETATELILNGLKPFDNCVDLLEFQDFVFSTQFFKEETYLKAALKVPEEKVLIVCDRGILDNKAYITDEQFTEILEKYNKKEINIRDNYDGVLHLVTAANGALEAYNLDNEARTESIQDAINLDNKTLDSWVGHPNLIQLDNHNNFEQKIELGLKAIYNFVEESIPINEYKYLIELPSLDILSKLKNVEIFQYYLNKNDENIERKIRQRGLPGDYVYYYIEKKTLPSGQIIKKEKIINSDEYYNLYKEINPKLKQLFKIRYLFYYKNQYFVLDKFSFDDKKAILEINSNKENIELPEYIRIIKNVKDDINYKNYNLAQKYNLL